MKKLNIFILVVLFFVTGCSYKYNVVVDRKKHVVEEIFIDEFNSVFSSKGTDADNFIDMNINFYKNDNNYSNYKIEKKLGNNSSGAFISSSYDNFKDYSKMTKVKKSLFGKVELYEDSGFGYFIANDYRGDIFFTDEESDFKNEVVEFNLTLPFQVVSNNADKIDLDKGIYTWYFRDNSLKNEINIKFDLNKIVVKENIFIKYIYIFIGLGLLLLLTIYIVIKNKKVNKI